MPDFLNAVRQIVKVYPRCLKLVWQAGRWVAICAFGLSILNSVVPVAQVWISKVAIDTVVDSLGDNSGTHAIDWLELLSPIGAILAVWMAGGVCQSASRMLSEQLGQQVRNYSQALIFRKASEMDMAFFENSEFFDEMEKARGEGYRANNLAVLSVSIVSSSVSTIAMLALLLHLHWAAVLILVATTLPQVVVAGYFAGRRFALEGAVTRNRRISDYLSRLLGSREAVKEIRIFGLHQELLKRFTGYWNTYVKQSTRLKFRQEKLGFLFGALSMAGTAAIWGYAVVRAAGRQITVGDVALAFQAAERSRSGLVSLFTDLGYFYEHSIFAGILFKFLDLERSSVDGALAPIPDSPAPVPKRIDRGIEFHNVSFRYPGTDRFVLKDLSFTITAGESAAIVGENGAGKTTLVKLLARFYDPTEGVILLDGKDLRDYDPKDLHRHIGVIFQDFVRYDLSARENIGFGQVDRLQVEDEIADAARKGGATEVVTKLPRGFDTILGRTLDEGVDLSGGEWQKVALSRAFMRRAQILILDEPTAALDAYAEYELHRQFAELTTGKMTIFISHRFSTVRMARHILILRDGQLVEEGSHEELMGTGGLYADMFNTQAEHYR